MKTTVTFRHTESSDAIRTYAQEKIDKIEKHLHRPVEALVVLSVEKFRHEAEVTVLADGLSINGREVTDDMYSAIDKVMEKVEKQAKKNRDRLKKRKGSNETPQLKPQESIGDETGSDLDMPEVTSSKRFMPKPLSIDDAVMELNDTKEEFIVYRNAETEQVNVLFRRSKGNFGLIEPPE